MAENDCFNCDRRLVTSPQPRQGIPKDRRVIPLVRVNGQVQDLLPGMQIPRCFVESDEESLNPFPGVSDAPTNQLKLDENGQLIVAEPAIDYLAAYILAKT